MRTCALSIITPVIAAVLAFAPPPDARAPECGSPLPPGAGFRPTQVTPVTLRILQTSVVRGSSSHSRDRPQGLRAHRAYAAASLCLLNRSGSTSSAV